MSMTVSFKHIRASKNLQQYAHEHMCEKLENLLGYPISLSVRFLSEKGMKTVIATARLRDGFLLTAKYSDALLFTAIDRTTEKLADQCHKHKSKRMARRTDKIFVLKDQERQD